MHLLTADNAADYLRESRHVATGERCEVERLSGGVSNEVFYVRRPDVEQGDFVLKQAREQLRVSQPWFSRLERILREVDVLRICERLLAKSVVHDRQASTPRILFEDRANYAFAMSAAPREHHVWKQLLLTGNVDPQIATACGHLLGTLHAGSWQQPEIARQLDDREIFDELRLDPYYRTTALAHPDLADTLSALVDSTWQHRFSLVHADFSPKNLLVWPAGLMMVDFETGHYGDPAFDLGFFNTHLVLKAVHLAPEHEAYLRLIEAFFAAYEAALRPTAGSHYSPLLVRGLWNLGGCLLARVDGKSPAEYLVDQREKQFVRDLARWLLLERLESWNDMLAEVRARLTTR